MKYLKYLLITVVVLVILFFAIGLLKPSVHYGHEVVVNKPLKEAWAVHDDETKLKEWIDGFVSIDILSGKEGEVGSTYKVIVNPGEGQDNFEMIETVESIKEFEYIKLLFDSDMMIFDQKTIFSEKDGKTIIKTESVVKGKGMMMRSMFALMEMLGGTFTKQEAINIEALKKVIEENTKDYYPEVLEKVE